MQCKYLGQQCLVGVTTSLFLFATIVKCEMDDFGGSTLNDESNLVIIRLFHSFNSSLQYQSRGLITINNHVPMIKQDSIPNDATERLRESALAGELYHLRAQAYRTLDIDNEQPYQVCTTFIKSCALYESSLSDQLIINLDINGKFVFLSANVANHHCSQSHPNQLFGKPTSNSFNTSLFVMRTALAHGPETRTYLNRIDQERQEKLRGTTQDNRSFLAKYWMYIVPVVIFMLLSSSLNPDGAAAPASR